jgi:Putative lumazine-binding
MATQTAPLKTESREQDAVVRAMQGYVDGVRLGQSQVMRPSFHSAATIFGHYPGGVMASPIQAVFDWIDQNGPSPNLRADFVKVEVLESIAYVQLEVRDLSGALTGGSVRMSDVFTLLQTEEGWKIAHKAFHWHK